MSKVKIPKIIHYCWFGDNTLDEKSIECIDSWKKHCPDYKIIEWNENNFDINCCSYVQEAYSKKMWAFVSDFARFWVLFNYGGIYFDTDVKMLKNIDPLVNKGPFMCWEENGDAEDGPYVAPGLGLAFEKNNPLCKEIVEKYRKIHFIDSNGLIDTYHNNVVMITSNILSEHGLSYDKSYQVINGVNIYPPDFLCPMNKFDGKINITNNTYTIHLYSGSWVTNKEKKCYTFEKNHKYIKTLILYKLIKSFYCYGLKSTFFKIYKKVMKEEK